MAVRERCSDTCSSLTEPEVHIDVAKLPGRSEREKVDSLKNSFPEIKPTSDLTQRPRNPSTQGRLRSCWLTSASMTNPARLCMSLPRPPPPPRSLFRRHKLIGPTNRANPEKWPLGHSCILPTAGRQTCTACPSQCVLFCMSVRGVGTDAAVGDGSDPGGWNRRRRGGGLQSHTSTTAAMQPTSSIDGTRATGNGQWKEHRDPVSRWETKHSYQSPRCHHCRVTLPCNL